MGTKPSDGPGALSDEITQAARSSWAARRAWLGWAMVALFGALAALMRYVVDPLPVDFSAYRAAAETFALGQNPYGDALFDAPSYEGFVYIYPPGTLPLLRPILWLPPRLMAGVDAILHVVAISASMAWIHRRFSLKVPLSLLVLLTFMWRPFTDDISVGNLAAYMFAAFLCCVWLSETRPGRRWHLGLAVACGIALAFKPMWGLSAGVVLLWRRRRGLAAALLAGALIVAGLSLFPWNGEVLVGPWLSRVEALRAKARAVTLLEIYAPLLPVVALGWLAAGWALMRRLGHRHPDLWLWACTSLLVWPRLSSYSFLLLLPVICFFWRRWGWQKTLLASLPTFGPLPWIFDAFDGGLGYHLMLYIWAWVIAAILFAILWRQSPHESARPGSPSRPEFQACDSISR